MQIFYLKMEKHCRVLSPAVKVGDIASVCCGDKALEEKLKCRTIVTYDLKLCGQKKVLSVLEVIDALQEVNEVWDGLVYVCNLGADATVLDLDFKDISGNQHSEKNKKALAFYKVIPVMLVTFFGSAFAIMAYNEEAQIGGVFEMITQVMGGGVRELQWMAAAYGVGIAAGVMIFFNHFGKKKFSDEPTPMEVEMAKYESDLVETRLNAGKKYKDEASP